ncbi:MAG: Eco57I restriction-modification methylase domain-containing protein, partial [Eubacteriaceae bacterium]|nr:Eco57I restriction-modification methylase domain-containing protein [Eubacteriaceae bacterium]
MGKKLFDYVIGNPPYQEETAGTSTSDKPIYNLFMNTSYEVADKVELITPARFLFNAGATPKKWNEKMLNDEHFKVLSYEPKSEKVFNDTDIKGGVAITYRDNAKSYGAIGAFTAFDELNSIKKKVDAFGEDSLSNVVTNRGLYRYSQTAYNEHPEELAKTSDARIAPNAFEKLSLLFTDTNPNDGHEYIQIFGLQKGKRVYKWVRKDYVKEVPNLYKYKVMIPKANGSGAIGEVLSTP